MNPSEGLTRIAKVFSWLAWLWLIGCVALAATTALAEPRGKIDPSQVMWWDSAPRVWDEMKSSPAYKNLSLEQKKKFYEEYRANIDQSLPPLYSLSRTEKRQALGVEDSLIDWTYFLIQSAVGLLGFAVLQR